MGAKDQGAAQRTMLNWLHILTDRKAALGFIALFWGMYAMSRLMTISRPAGGLRQPVAGDRKHAEPIRVGVVGVEGAVGKAGFGGVSVAAYRT